jgi:hypothetical protein
VKAFEAVRQPTVEDDWTEEDDAEFADLLKEMKAEEEPEEGSGEDHSEESDGEDT